MLSEAALYCEIGSRVRKARERLGLSQEWLAGTAGLTRTSITNLEAGRQRTQVHVLMVIAARLGVSLVSLFPPEARSRP